MLAVMAEKEIGARGLLPSSPFLMGKRLEQGFWDQVKKVWTNKPIEEPNPIMPLALIQAA